LKLACIQLGDDRPSRAASQSARRTDARFAIADGLFGAGLIMPFSSEISRIDQSMSIVPETEQIADSKFAFEIKCPNF
jgi:hypothetical protein